MIKNLLTAVFVLLTATSAAAADTPRSSSAVVQFVGRVVEDSCAVTVGKAGTQIDLGTQKGLVPVDVTFLNCEAEKVPSFRLVTDKDSKQAVLTTSSAHASVRLYRDEAGKECLTAGENLLCDEVHQTRGKDQTYRAMYAKLDADLKAGNNVMAVAVVEMQFD